MDKFDSILQEYWKYNAFRPLQKEIIKSISENKKDTLAILPTGAGKSICYQVSALYLEGLCLVISPLIALMKDQVLQLKQRGILASAIYSGMHFIEIKNILELCVKGKLKLLYISPERLQTKVFQEYLKNINISFIAVDEAHCISQWGYDFRPAYLEIKVIKEFFSTIPIIALTASATLNVQKDICNQLELKNPNIFLQSYERKEISYSSFNEEDKVFKILNILKKINSSTLIYCSSRKKCEEISTIIKSNNFNVDFYHAGLENKIRNKKQEDWLNNKIQIMVCTNAFGMGIDKPDVRLVIHYNLCLNLESYYQEAGRAGRDKKKSYAVILYNDKDFINLEKQILQKYPSIEIIKKVYIALNNYYKIALGNGLNFNFDFNIENILPQLKDLELHQILGSIEILKQFKIINIIENMQQPDKIWICCNKNYFTEFQNNIPTLYNFLDYLTRNFNGIWFEPVNIFLDTLALKLNTNVTDIKRKIAILEKSKVINYMPAINGTQIYFLINRITHLQQYLDIKLIEERKKNDLNKFLQIKKYTTQNEICKSIFISNYFGDKNINECGVCDICLKKQIIKTKEVNILNFINEIKNKITDKGISINELKENFKTYSNNDLKNAIDLLLKENEITYSKNGFIYKK